MRERLTVAAVALMVVLPLSGCVLAAGGAAASGVYFTSRGAEAILDGNTDEVTGAARQAFESLGIQWEGQREKDDGETHELWGRADDDEVTVEVHRRTESASRVEVRVRQGAVKWDKELARRIVEEMKAVLEG